MTASTITTRAPRSARRRPVPWTRLAWVTWRQHRPALTGAAAFLGLVSLYLLIMGLQINPAYDRIASCHPAGSGTCRQLLNAFSHEYWGGGGGGALSAGGAQTVSSLMLVVPVMLGVFLGAPVLAREFETGTFRFAWTQGCGRLRWAVSRLVLLAVLVTAVAWAFTELFTWYYHALLAPDPNAFITWLAQQHYTQWTTYEPASRFWHFQLIEGGWLLALSAVLIAAAVWLV